MRLVTFIPSDGQPRAGVTLGTAIVDLAAAAPLALEDSEGHAWDMLSLLRGTEEGRGLEDVAEILSAVISQIGSDLDVADGTYGNGSRNQGMAGSISIGGVEMLLPMERVRLLAPLPRPSSLRLFEAFEQHVLNLHSIMGRALPSAWYRLPAFVFGNHGAVYGPDAVIARPASAALDYELELACVIGREGRDIDLDEALEYVAGYTIANDWSARDAQLDAEAGVLDSAKVKDFATSLGPWIVTPDELEIYADDDGRFNLMMTARVNGIERSRGNTASIHHTFASMIAHASRDATLYPGDVLCSGAVGGGSLLEITQGQGPWLEQDDTVELEITGLGMLRNRIG